MIRSSIILLCVLAFCTTLPAQTKISWGLLQACELPSGRIDFTEEVEALDGQLVTIKGFMIPLDTEGIEYALSAFPMSECFFCGNAGPTSMLELQLTKAKRYSLDSYETFTGKLVLSPAPQGLVFILEEAEEG